MSDQPQRPRSTPIPSEPFSVPAGSVPPTPTEFINSQPFSAPPAPPPGASRPALPGMYPQGSGEFQVTPVGQPRKRSGCGLVLFIFTILLWFSYKRVWRNVGH